MPTYNGERFVAAALSSIAGQDASELEVVIVDDGSSDRTLDIVRQFENSLAMRIFTPGRMANWVTVTNLGLREARGEWACFLHQDDFWLPGRIKRIREELGKAEGSLVLHNAVFVGPVGQRLGRWSMPLSAGTVDSHQFTEHLLVQNFVAMPSPVFRRKAVIDSGGLDESLWFSADWDLWLRLGAMGPVRFIDEELSAFRLHSESQTVSRRLRLNEWEQQLTTVLARHIENCGITDHRRRELERVAKASIAVNAMLSARFRGDSSDIAGVARQLLSLGPSGWYRYMRDSRIVQRTSSRLRLRATEQLPLPK